MWHVTLTGHNPDDLADVKTFTVRGESVRTLSSRCRAAAEWTSNVNLHKVADGHYEITPSKRGRKSGMAKCIWVDNPIKPVVSREQVEQSMLSTFTTAALVCELVQRLNELNRGLDAYDTKQLMDELIKRRNAIKSEQEQA